MNLYVNSVLNFIKCGDRKHIMINMIDKKQVRASDSASDNVKFQENKTKKTWKIQYHKKQKSKNMILTPEEKISCSSPALQANEKFCYYSINCKNIHYLCVLLYLVFYQVYKTVHNCSDIPVSVMRMGSWSGISVSVISGLDRRIDLRLRRSNGSMPLK